MTPKDLGLVPGELPRMLRFLQEIADEAERSGKPAHAGALDNVRRLIECLSDHLLDSCPCGGVAQNDCTSPCCSGGNDSSQERRPSRPEDVGETGPTTAYPSATMDASHVDPVVDIARDLDVTPDDLAHYAAASVRAPVEPADDARDQDRKYDLHTLQCAFDCRRYPGQPPTPDVRCALGIDLAARVALRVDDVKTSPPREDTVDPSMSEVILDHIDTCHGEKMGDDLRRHTAALRGALAHLRSQLASSEYRTNEQIRDKHRILAEYEQQTRQLKSERAAAMKQIALLSETIKRVRVALDVDGENG